MIVDVPYPFTPRDVGDDAPNLLREYFLYRAVSSAGSPAGFTNDVVQITLRVERDG